MFVFFFLRSGSTYAYSVLDEGYREDMSLQEAAALAKRAVRHATYRDAFSGAMDVLSFLVVVDIVVVVALLGTLLPYIFFLSSFNQF